MEQKFILILTRGVVTQKQPEGSIPLVGKIRDNCMKKNYEHAQAEMRLWRKLWEYEEGINRRICLHCLKRTERMEEAGLSYFSERFENKGLVKRENRLRICV